MTQNIQHICPACAGNLQYFARPRTVAGTAYGVWRCPRCAFGVTSPLPDDATLHELHSTQYYRNGEGVRFVRVVELIVEGMRRLRVARLSRWARTGRVLDIGCGSGRFLRAMRSAGWEVAGLELNDETATAARKVHGLAVETTLDAFGDQSFDLITITHVLEHIRDPSGMLRRCVSLLKPGGVMAVAVPNIDGWQARLTRENWFHLDVPRHLWHFSEAWLATALRELGFEILATRRLDLAHNIFGWLQSLLNLAGLKHNRLYTFLGSDDLETGSTSAPCSLLVSILILPLLLPLSIVLAVVEAVAGAGGTVEIIARSRRC